MLLDLRQRAENRDQWAIDELMTRPALPSEVVPYFAAFLTLARDRPRESISLGLAGGLSLPRPVPLETIRREGQRLGHVADALDDFVDIVAGLDDFAVELDIRRQADEASTLAQKRR